MRLWWLPLYAALGAVAGCTGGDGLADDGSNSVSVSIGPAGGVIRSSDGNLRIEVPANAIAEETLFTISNDRNAIAGHIGEAYQVAPQISLTVPATVYYFYGTTDIGRPPDRLAVGANPEGSWELLDPVTLNVPGTEVSGPDMDIAFNYGLIDIGDTSTGTDTTTGTDTDPTDSATTMDPSTTTIDPSTTSGSTSTSTGGSSTGPGTTTGAEPLCGDGIPVITEVCYTEGITFNSPTTPTAIVTGDWDGDGNQDVAVAGGGAIGEIEVRFGNGSGILASPATYPVGTNPSAVAVGRMDAGAVDDLVVVNEDDATVGVLLGAANGTFGNETAYAVGGTLPVALVIDDFDGAGGLDVLTANSGSSDVTFMAGDGNGALTASGDFAVTAAPSAIGAGDFTGDTNLDFVTAAAANLTLNAGNGAGVFGGASDNAVGGVAAGVFVADYNNDMNLDAAVTTDTNNVVIAIGDGLTGFGGGVPYAVGAGPTAVLAADIDRDNELDLVVVNSTAGTITILIGNGLGAFSTPSTFNVGANPTAVTVADFNEDNVLDIVVTNSGDDDTSILLSNP